MHKNLIGYLVSSKQKITVFAYGLNGLLFLTGSIDLIGGKKFIMGIIQVVAAALNFGMLFRTKNLEIKEMLNRAILIANVVVAVSIGIDYQLSGKSFIHYAWYLAALVSGFALMVQLRKERKTADILRTGDKRSKPQF